MNDDELRDLLHSAGRDDRPADGRELSRVRSGIVRRRRFRVGAAAGGTALAVAAVAVGFTLPSSGRTASITPVSPPSQSITPTATPTPTPTTVPVTSSTPVAPSTVASTVELPPVSPVHTAAPAGVSFTWNVHTYGEWVEVSGTWSGVMTSFGGVRGVDLPPEDLVGEYGLSNPGYASGVGSTAANIGGGGPPCSGTPTRHVTTMPIVWYRFARPGSYRLSLDSFTCGGSVPSTTTLVAGAGDPFTADFMSTLPTTATVGQTLSVSTRTASPVSPADGVTFAVSPKGAIVRISGGSAGTYCNATVPGISSATGRLTFTEAGTWRVYAGVSCSDETTYLEPGQRGLGVLTQADLQADQLADLLADLLGEQVRTVTVTAPPH